MQYIWSLRSVVTHAHLPCVKAEHQMACENDKFKQKLLLKHVLPDDNICIFADVTCLTSDDRHCIRHAKPCEPLLCLISFLVLIS